MNLEQGVSRSVPKGGGFTAPPGLIKKNGPPSVSAETFTMPHMSLSGGHILEPKKWRKKYVSVLFSGKVKPGNGKFRLLSVLQRLITNEISQQTIIFGSVTLQ